MRKSDEATKVRATKEGARSSHEGRRHQSRERERPVRVIVDCRLSIADYAMMTWSAHVLLLGLFLSGCTAPKHQFHPQQSTDKLGDIEFTHYLATVPIASVDEGTRAVLLTRGESRKWRAFRDRKAELVKRGAIRESWKLEPQDILDKGTLAHMLRVTCGLPRGINELVLSPMGLGRRRYALKTCIHEGILPYARAGEPVTGGELLAAVNAASEYVELRNAK